MMIEKKITELMQKSGFGKVILPIQPVFGGFLHRMYKVVTDSGSYAVKHLNPEIMGREGVQENFARAERIEAILEQNRLPIVPAISINGKKMQELQEQYFYVFPWLDGNITDWNNSSVHQCRTAGNILGKIHAINPQEMSHEEPEISSIDWNGYLQRAVEKDSEIASVLEHNLQLLKAAEAELNAARAALPDIRCISNEDMDPKNIMWQDGKPWVIDLECLDYGNPVSHALQLALQWSGSTTCHIDAGKLTAFFEGYLAAYDNGFRAYSEVFGLAYTWVEWLEYNIKRALGMCGDEAERQMGVSEVRNTVDRIAYLRRMENELRETLEHASMQL